jgi:diguanylate cyclase (GGDEF)-like protein
MPDHIKATILALDPDQDFLQAIQSLNPAPEAIKFVTHRYDASARPKLSHFMQECYPDVVIVNLDVDDVLEFASPVPEIHAIPMGLPPLILGTSARDGFTLKQKAYHIGIDDFLLRPFPPQELWFRVNVLLRMRRLQRQIDAASRNLSLLNTKLSTSNRKLEQLTLTDDLTGLSNMRYMNKFLEDHFPILKRYPRPFTLLMMDLDHFKQVNDKNDHLVGSSTIRQVGIIIDELMRKMDIKARYGGDEYIVAMPETDRTGSVFAGERLREAIEKMVVIGSEGNEFHISSSIGLAGFDPERHSSYKDLIRDADSALYAAKYKGRNRVEYYVHGETDVLLEKAGVSKDELR